MSELSGKLIGYIVYLEESDEFLIKRSKDGYLWGKSKPELAMRFATENQAKYVVKKHGKNAVIGMLYESENRYILKY
ncbi:hypothetical protein [Teredinibacter sp. KSP-S5-2]|uniref:hypothetical protein n=1 Tax=Teredinibacter sp. KSP-S5-2 TaxID=3034506 RepID=UPI002934A127|nr:hypothetical protein [Teredinibacter sp. KSP-S5-2]WNO11424.1 hypothetical protein P5V12_09600 [Teredinibacter sp. KSP-S5-2]WNO11430.1 hypothetical protein P5V12_09630 [Teredinibacter sp. KSP-S5-2]